MKKNMKNRILACIISIFTIMSIIPASAFAANDEPQTPKGVNDYTLANYLPYPFGGCTPATELIGNPQQYTGTVAWKDSNGNTPTTFEINTAYIATITLTPTTPYTFTGGESNSFHYNDAKSISTTLNDDGTLTVIVQFPETSGLTVEGGSYGTDYVYGNNKINILTSTEMTISGTTTRDGIYVETYDPVNIILKGVDITYGSSYGSCALSMTEEANVNLTLAPGTINKLTAEGDEACGISVPYQVTTLTINGTGTLIATGQSYGAGIGDNSTYGCGKIIINGGTVIAQGGYSSAGIGNWGSGEYSAGTIIINGGTVTSKGGENSIADIGYYTRSSSPGNVTITGGSVNAPRISDQPTNGSCDTYLTTITLNQVHEETEVSAITAKSADGSPIDYGIRDVKTDKDGKLYLYLPEGSVVSSVTAGENTYTYPSITTNSQGSASGTMYVPAPATMPKVQFSFDGKDANKLTGTTTEMMYSLDGGDTWTLCTEGSTDLTGKTVTEEKGIKVKNIGNGISTTESDIQSISITKADKTVNYKIIEGADGTCNHSGNGTYTIRANGDFSKFLNVTMDGSLVSSDKYDAREGSTIITFHKDYMDSLNNGSHDIVVNFTDGTAETTVKVDAASSGSGITPSSGDNSPSTSDNSSLFMWMLLVLVSGSLLAMYGFWEKKKKPCSMKH